MNTASILTKEAIERLLKIARENLVRDGFLLPVLFLQLAAKAPLILELRKFPNTSLEKQAYFGNIGAHFGRLGQRIEEAVSLAEAWMVLAQQAPAAFRFPPSRHPSRQEVLALVGRDAANTRSTQVIQPFARDAGNKPLWREPAIAVYNEPVMQGHHAHSLLDDLFLANQRVGT